MPSKSQLAIILSKLKQFDNPKIVLEQYSTEPEVAAAVLWFAFMQGDIQGKTIADLGCGPGIFGIGAAILGAKMVYFVDMDNYAINTTRDNISQVEGMLEGVELELLKMNVAEFTKRVDVVLQNPPFGTKIKHHDRLFLSKAFEVADVVYSIHKITSKGFIEAFSRDNGFSVTHVLPYEMRLVRSMKHHKKPVVKVKVACWRLERRR
ncbi:DNA methylase [Candidatus Woesearchaeota archaeon]|nr:METTL5 family protein [Candidatus Woesearchaeota archaeon]RLE42738.1 MAG: DNA methylase [Candidatus Woesearchaeota archaeon]